MRVRTAAGLDVADRFRVSDVADVEDADSAQTILADGVLDAAGAAVDARTEIFAGDEEQILVDRDVTLRSRAEVRSLDHRLMRIGDIPDLIAAEAPLEDVIPEEREVGVDAAHEFFRRFGL